MMSFFERLQQETAAAQAAMYTAPVIAEVQQGHVSTDMYIAFLTQAYHHVKHTVPLLMACGSRLSEDDEWIREAIAEYIEEEKGHQVWILNDIQACGGDADAVRGHQGQGKAGQAIELMIAYLYHQIDRGNPMALFGMVWVLEGSSVRLGGEMAKKIQTTLALPPEAMTYLISHSVLDQDHLQFFESLMNQVTCEADQAAIIASANMVFDLYGQMLRALPAYIASDAA